ncbi:MAG: DUF1569 domain-containing protein [Sphingobacteriales bacterium]|nr:DUF1569 domain-containing protein [Sphingobacteriales bacterium]
MALPNMYAISVADDFISRINKLTPETSAKWGKMNVSQMLAHCCVTYEYIFEERSDRPNFFLKLMLKTMVKSKVVSETPYTQNGPTGPAFIIADVRDFQKEKTRLLNYICKVTERGAAFFEGKESVSFGELTSHEWNNMMYKHLDHHLRQFGV